MIYDEKVGLAAISNDIPQLIIKFRKERRRNLIMRIIAVLALTLMSFAAFGQYVDSAQYAKTKERIRDMRYYMYDAGYRLEKFSNTYYTGVTLQLSGAVIGIGGVLLMDGEEAAPVVALGAITTFIGAVLTISAHSHVKAAGKYLQDGGLVFPMNTPKMHKLEE